MVGDHMGILCAVIFSFFLLIFDPTLKQTTAAQRPVWQASLSPLSSYGLIFCYRMANLLPSHGLRFFTSSNIERLSSCVTSITLTSGGRGHREKQPEMVISSTVFFFLLYRHAQKIVPSSRHVYEKEASKVQQHTGG